jgi:hypothetical protein
VVIGWEAFIVLQDTRGLDQRQQEEITVWAATALVRATLAELDSAFDGQALAG